MKSNQTIRFLLAILVALVLSAPLFAQEAGASANQGAAPAASTAAPSRAAISAGKQKVQGIISQADANGFLLRQASGGDIPVKLTNATEIREKKSNPFRGAKKYGMTQLVRGLNVEVEGRGDNTGALIADKVRFTQDSLQTADVVETRVTPVENRMGTAETRLKASEENAKRLSGQIDELNGLVTTAQNSAKGAQETADGAVAGVKAANERVTATNERITSLDDYDAIHTATVLFRAGSAVLSDEAKSKLEEVATQAKKQKGFVIEVAGFASKDGGESLNQRLSDMRAQAVVRYLAQQQDIPLRRIITPFGYADSHPVSDNSTHQGRVENRRVEVKLLVNRGLGTPAGQTTPAVSQMEPPKTTGTGETH